MENYNNLYIKIVDYSDQLTDCFRARYMVYCLLKKWIDPLTCENKLEKDEFDKYAKHIIIYNIDNKIQAYTRLILKSGYNLPIVKHPGLKINNLNLNRSAEASRFIVVNMEYRTAFTYLLLRTLFVYCYKNGIENCLIVVDPPFLRYLNKIGFKCLQIGEPTYYFGDYTIPVNVQIKKSAINYEKINDVYSNWFLEDNNTISKSDFIFQYLYQRKAA